MKVLSKTCGALLAACALFAVGCSGDSDGRTSVAEAQSCMTCHNGSPEHNDYSGPGLENPHPFPGADQLLCTSCHGGNPNGADMLTSHVPPPPEIGDRDFQTGNGAAARFAYFNKLTLTGIDKLSNYTVDGQTYTPTDYLQFLNPGDLRVTSAGRGCGQCHSNHAECVAQSLLATEAGVLSGGTFAAGVPSEVPESAGLYEDTAVDKGFRAVTDATPAGGGIGTVDRLLEFPVFSTHGEVQPDSIHNNNLYLAAGLADDVDADNALIPGSPLANLYHEQLAFTCGDCHLGSAGANNRAGDFRGSGCTACHMPYSLDGRSRSGDPNVPTDEPADPDDIDDPERPHVRRHMILSVAKQLPSGEMLPGIDDYSCAGCHQGSNRTVMQYWGIRLDQNQDVRNNRQYPANPASWQGTHGDARLFDPLAGNNTFNGRNANQYLRFEDYDGDGRDDTPADVHYEAGMGCIDCHGSYDLHGGDVSGGGGADVHSRMEQAVAIRCESCHGDADGYAPTVAGTNYDGEAANLAVDSQGNPLRHVWRDSSGNMYLKSRLTGATHFVSQTRDVVVDSGRTNPLTSAPIYTVKGSYAMGRADGNAATGIGPLQTAGHGGFSHMEDLSCAACHSSWTNSCVGCHLEGEYNTNNNNFSNITGSRIVFRERNADFVYQSPVLFQLGVDSFNKIASIAPNTDTFFQYRDRQGNFSDTFAFSDRNGAGNSPTAPGKPALSHNVLMPHSIRGKVSSSNEGPRYCVSCHLTDDAITDFGSQYATFRSALGAQNYAALDFNLLAQHIGQNPGNQLNSPFFVHMAAGLGTGLFLFDEDGCPENPLDTFAGRKGCDGVAPASSFDPTTVAFDLDRIVEPDGRSNSSNSHPMMSPGATPNLRDGALDPNLAGPLGAAIIQRLVDPTAGIVLDSWLNANGEPEGDAGTHLGTP